MIHVRTQLADINGQPVLHISLVDITAIEQFEKLLARALNTADPLKHTEWIKLSDELHKFIAATTPI